MANPEIIDFIRTQRGKQVADSEIREKLLSVGWPLSEVDSAFADSASQHPIVGTTGVAIGDRLPGLGELLSHTWAVLTRRWQPLAILILLATAAYIVLTIIFRAFFSAIFGGNVFGSMSITFAWEYLLGLLFILAVFSILPALFQVTQIKVIAADSDDVSPIDALKSSWPMIGNAWWTLFLRMLIIGVGFIIIIPGIVFIVLYSFAMFVLVTEGLSGNAALERSKQLVSGYGWDVFFRYLGFLVVFILGYILLLMIGGAVQGFVFVSLLSALYSTFMGVLVQIFGFIMFQYLRSMKGK
jgi:hypothetical protein